MAVNLTVNFVAAVQQMNSQTTRMKMKMRVMLTILMRTNRHKHQHLPMQLLQIKELHPALPRRNIRTIILMHITTHVGTKQRVKKNVTKINVGSQEREIVYAVTVKYLDTEGLPLHRSLRTILR